MIGTQTRTHTHTCSVCIFNWTNVCGQVRGFIDSDRPDTVGGLRGKKVWHFFGCRNTDSNILKPDIYSISAFFFFFLNHFSVVAGSHTENRAEQMSLHPEKPTLLDYCCLSQGVPPQPLVTMLWLGEECTKPSQRFQVIVVSLQQAVGNPLPLIWELKGAVFYCSSNNVLPAPSAPPPGASW